MALLYLLRKATEELKGFHSAKALKKIAAETVAGYSARDGFLRASAKSREMITKFESTQDFETHFL